MYELGNPIHDLRLVLYAVTAPGEITETWEDVTDGDDGRAHWTHAVVYKFRLPDGREVIGTEHGSRRLLPELADLKKPVAADVEYDPSNPSINRLKGSGSQSLSGWFLRTAVALGLLAMFLAPGIQVFRDGLAEMRGVCSARGRRMNSRHVVAVLATVGVLVGLGDMPYGYYTILRLMVCGFSLFLLFGDVPIKAVWQRWVTGACAVLYNPLLPVHIGEKGIWIGLNILTVVWFWFLATSSGRNEVATR
jgi:hypothetical protein